MPAVFPTLKTGAVAQYPATEGSQFASFVVRFLDGGDQRYRQFPAPLRSWVIKLNMLDETELISLEQFFMAQEGSFGTFSFVDPWTQTTFTNCSLNQDTLPYAVQGEMQGTASLTVTENRV
jgi:Conserved hypothetical protein 2217 (DUF2460)